jgi:uncharacterized SAM-binding protein YcdF (DUF218 family)
MMLKRKLLIFFVGLFILIIALFIFRVKILTAIGQYLIVDTANGTTTHMVILSGGAMDRCAKAYEVWKMGGVTKIILTGGNKSKDFLSVGLDYFESDIMYQNFTKNYHLPDSVLTVIHEGTSTMEEAYIIKDYCRITNIKKITIVSSSFHTRRVSQVMKKVLSQQGIQFYIAAAPNKTYNEHNWWKNEYGLIACNNEYLKQIYYLFK